MSWLRKIFRVIMVVALGACASLPFRLLPPPNAGSSGGSADRIVLQNDSTKTVQETPLQIAPPTTVAESNAEAGDSTSNAEATRTASNRAAQSTRKDLPAWNSKLESTSPPPALPDAFESNGVTPNQGANPIIPFDGTAPLNEFPSRPPNFAPSAAPDSAVSPGF